jgi:hypothetical protein
MIEGKAVMRVKNQRTNRHRVRCARAVVLLCSLCGFGTAGCETDLSEPGTCERAHTCGPPCSLHPDLGPGEDRCGIYVAKVGKNTNLGDSAHPVKTFARAFELALQGRMRVYACAEDFDEVVHVPAGVDVWGGNTCDNLVWNYHADLRTIIAPTRDVVPLEVVASEHALDPSLLLNLRAEAMNAGKPGGISVAMRVGNGTAAQLERSDIFAGAGNAPGGSSIALIVQEDGALDVLDSSIAARDGAKGEDGSEPDLPYASDGRDGNPGSMACSKEIVPGGQYVVTQCGIYDSIGADGGDGLAEYGGDGRSGREPPVPNETGYGLGGLGQDDDTPSCLEGREGASGAVGMNGQGAKGPGIFGPMGWVGVKGGDGMDGLPGQGGGGGGASRGGMMHCGTGPQGGASGGSGGAGGCGGKGAKGGGYGGSSIGLLAYKATVTVNRTLIATGRGQNGGNGGAAQYGGLGGYGGRGGQRDNGSAPGCDGGRGGFGGNGGYGGGGLGGHSIGIASVGAEAPKPEGGLIQVGIAGAGGRSGHAALPEIAGESGMAEEIKSFP